LATGPGFFGCFAFYIFPADAWGFDSDALAQFATI
jgi:hypothetical protein